MANLRRASLVAGNKTRVQGVSTEQTVKNAAGVLHRIIVANANGAAQTLTVTDGTVTQTVLRVAAGGATQFDFGVGFATAIKVTPSHADIDALAIWD